MMKIKWIQIGFLWGITSCLGQVLEAQNSQPKTSVDAYFQQEESGIPAKTTPPSSPLKNPSSKFPQPTPEQLEKSFEPTRVVAIVAGEPIFLGDMLLEINQTIEQILENAPPEIKERERKNALEILVPRFIPKFVDAKLLYLDAIKQLPDGADVEQILEQAAKDFDKSALDTILERSKLNSPIEYDAHLRNLGSSLRKMRESWAQEQFTGYFLNQSLQYDRDITHEQLLQYYNKNLDDYRIESKVRWEELMVRFDQFPSKEEAYKALVAMGNEVVYGAKFAAVAERASHGFTSEKGGIHDWTTEGSLVDKKLEEALFTLPLNELSDLIETKIGAHIVRVIERQQEGVMSFGEAQAGIKEKLIQENRSKAFDARLNQLRREIPYEIVWK